MFLGCRIHALPGIPESDMESQYLLKTNHIRTGNAFRNIFGQKKRRYFHAWNHEEIFANVMYIKISSLYKDICVWKKCLSDIFSKEKRMSDVH